jgi:prevent-host-death family protein
MVQRIGSRDARRRFADLLGQVDDDGEVIIVEHEGRPVAALVPVALAEALLATREARFAVLDRVRAKLPTVPPDEVAFDVAAAVGEVREAAARYRTPPDSPDGA